mgnify:CR=1 FL=1
MSEPCKKSVIVPMNPRGSYSGGSTPGSIIAQEWFCKRHRNVLISFDKGCKYTNSAERPSLGFFYNTSRHKVTHRFSIFDITDDEGATKYKNKFLPPWRRELLETSLRPGEQRTWLLIGKIRRLDEPQDLAYFGKRRAQSFVYSTVGSELTYSEKTTSPDEFIDDVIFRCVVSGTEKLREDDLELIMWALIVDKGGEYLERQRSYEDDGKRLRLDMLMKNSKGEYVVVELKLDEAEKDALDKQLRPYMRKVMAEHGLAKLRGVIVARRVSAELEEELSKTSTDIHFAPYGFTFRSGCIEKALFH